MGHWGETNGAFENTGGLTKNILASPVVLSNGCDTFDWRFLGEQRFDDQPFFFSGLELYWNGRLRKLGHRFSHEPETV